MDELIAAAVSKLTQAGYHCRAAFPGFRLPQLEAPMVVVSLSEFTLRPAACGDYIGTNAALTGFYGERFDGVLQFEVYSPFRSGGSVCTDAAFSVMETLRGGLDNYTLSELHAEQTVYDPKGDCFHASVSAKLSAWYCRAEET